MGQYDKHKYNNTVIQSEGGEHGRKVIEFWRKQGVDAGEFYEMETPGYYFGLFGGEYQVKFKVDGSMKVIPLPSADIYPKVMWVSEDADFSERNTLKLVVLCKVFGKYITTEEAKSLESCEEEIDFETFNAIAWSYAKDIEEETVTEPLLNISKRDLTILLQNCAIHFGVTHTPKDDGTTLELVDKWVNEATKKLYPREQRLADAKLIAAAPELLEKLISLVLRAEIMLGYANETIEAKEIIKKATE